MPASQVMKEWKAGNLHSGSSKGPIVTKQPQAVAIMLSEKAKEQKTSPASSGAKRGPKTSSKFLMGGQKKFKKHGGRK